MGLFDVRVSAYSCACTYVTFDLMSVWAHQHTLLSSMHMWSVFPVVA